MGNTMYKLLALGASVAAASAARNAASGLWRSRVGDDPPKNPADPGTSWGEAVAWTLVTGAFVGLARMLAQRGAAEAFRAVEGDYPEALQDVD